MKKIELLDNAPDQRSRSNERWAEVDEVITVLIENPGKWALIESRPNTPSSRVVHRYQRRYGTAFKFRTTVNKDADTIEVYASYQKESQ